ncbi:hypothetical protein EST38_g9439 [Candolleomyces aberdarensis]|uniref:BTB domain-containing protein n=1 Tax=Candolleomyces aberdarensis TaxID=2316362 RepID=A0A4Q2D9Y9_9AGAR|nr:hypothetical protein EST38_g9439 [Candolleomyces aberdarensis]
MTQTSPTSPPSMFDKKHYWDFVTFSVQGCLFRLPKHRFVEESELFCKQYDLDFNMEKEYGLEDQQLDVVKLDVDVEDFRAFLTVLYPRNGDDASLNLDQWRAVLRLSTKWFFNDIRGQAIMKIDVIDLPLPERIALAKDHQVSSWLLAGYRQLVVRKKAITVEEAEKIDLRKAILVCELRERFKEPYFSDSDIEDGILAAFNTDFNKIRETEVKYPTKKEKKAMEAKEAETREDEEAKALMEEEEIMRQEAIQRYDSQLEEQRLNLVRLEREKEQVLLNEPLYLAAPTAPTPLATAGGSDDVEGPNLKKKKGKRK